MPEEASSLYAVLPLVWPLQGDYRITQEYGEQKVDYARFGLLAHNGLDIAAPAGTPKPIVDRIHQAMVKALAMPDVKEAFGKQGMVPAPSTSPEAFAEQSRQYLVCRLLLEKRSSAKPIRTRYR